MAKRRKKTRRPPTPPIPPEALYWRVDQFSDVFQLSLGRSYELVDSGIVPSVRIGRNIRIPKQQLMSMLAADPRLLETPEKSREKHQKKLAAR